MNSTAPDDTSNGYESAAANFISARSLIGAAEVRTWARGLPRGGAVLDLGCGHGEPVTRTLLDAGLSVYGVDASPGLLAELRRRFPSVTTECALVEESAFFDRTFDGVIAWGLMFLLKPEAQALVVRKAVRAVKPGGQFLFTAPSQACEWRDALTGRISISLGAETYRALLHAEGMDLVHEEHDDGANHYYCASRQA
ncbi:MAG TPA: class I SAM-dependent methyltransferase [Acidobacteriota bacterium]|nr:class I SAM-dependent methyltransferase [Acidobacteriota bacterium]